MKRIKPNYLNPYFTNNARKMAGLPLRRKKDRRKRFYTRREVEETIDALFDWWNS